MTEITIDKMRGIIKETTSNLILKLCYAGNIYLEGYEKSKSKITKEILDKIDMDIKSLESIRHLSNNTEITPNITDYFYSLIKQIKDSEYLKTENTNINE